MLSLRSFLPLHRRVAILCTPEMLGTYCFPVLSTGNPLTDHGYRGFGGLIRAVLREDAHAEKLARDLMTPEPRSRPTLRDVTLSRAPFSTNKVAKLIGNIFSVRSGKLAPAAEKRVFGFVA
jgi:hypothetical protein